MQPLPRSRPPCAGRGRSRADVRHAIAAAAVGALALLGSATGFAQTTPAASDQAAPAAPAAPAPPAAPAAAPNLTVTIAYITQIVPEPPPLSLVEPIVTDKGLAGTRKGMQDNATTGRLLKQQYKLVETVVPEHDDFLAAARKLLNDGNKFIVADVDADRLLKLADLPEAKDAIIFNIRARDVRLRIKDCRANVFHTIPDRAMDVDALAQYLVFKRWRRWFVVHGTAPDDLLYLEAIRRAAKKFGAKIVEEKSYTYDPSSRRVDTGHFQIQTQMNMFTQRSDDYDVTFVADESDIFGEYLPYRTFVPRPVVGTQGLIATAWHRTHEQWAGTQMQRRFSAMAHRDMTERDYTGWLAARSVGEAVTQTGKADVASVRAFMLSKDFRLGAFKGEGLTFRSWDHQMRQPILLAAPRALVSVSPQEGFLHERTPLDTLGYDMPESACRLD